MHLKINIKKLKIKHTYDTYMQMVKKLSNINLAGQDKKQIEEKYKINFSNIFQIQELKENMPMSFQFYKENELSAEKAAIEDLELGLNRLKNQKHINQRKRLL